MPFDVMKFSIGKGDWRIQRQRWSSGEIGDLKIVPEYQLLEYSEEGINSCWCLTLWIRVRVRIMKLPVFLKAL